MPVELSPELSRELEGVGGKPLQVVDPLTQKVYVIVAGDLFDRLRALFDEDEFDIRETYGAQQAALANVWDDPELDAYNDYGSGGQQR
jgi:hypothetical protein